MAESSIEWTDATWNPVAGCSIVSPGCHNCYAMTMAARLEAMGQEKYRGLTKKSNGKALWTGKITLDKKALEVPLNWKKPKRVFVNSMSDLFHEDVPDEFIDHVFITMGDCLRHTFQILSKRAERLSTFMQSRPHFAMPNVWLGVSVEDQKRADERIPLLLQTPAAIRFLSCEPLLGPVDLKHIKLPGTPEDSFLQPLHEVRKIDALTGEQYAPLRGGHGALGFDGPHVDWVIVGGESGHGARPCNLDWIREIVAQCKAAGVSCFVKQLGSKPYSNADKIGHRNMDFKALIPERSTAPVWWRFLNDKKGGSPDEWPEDLRIREYPEVNHATS